MQNDGELSLALFVKHGREQAAADFYAAAFGAHPVTSHHYRGELTGVEMDFDTIRICVTGANPKRDEDASLGGPRSPEASGTISASLRLTVGDLEAAVRSAVAAGANIRDGIQIDVSGLRVATLFDPFGHFWVLSERRAEKVDLAA